MKLSEKRIDQIAKKLWIVSLRIPQKRIGTNIAQADWATLNERTRDAWRAIIRFVCSELPPDNLTQPAKSCSIVDGKKVCK